MISRQNLRVTTPVMALLGLGFLFVSTVGAVVAASPAAQAARTSPHDLTPSQVVVNEVDAVRAQFGLPPAQVTHAYDAAVTAATMTDDDPSLANLGSGMLEGFGVWGIAPTVSPALAPDPGVVVNGWVYDDGWNGANTANLDCTGPGAPGCDGHRRAILSAAPAAGAQLYIDVAASTTQWQGAPALSIASILVWRSGASSTPALTPKAVTPKVVIPKAVIPKAVIHASTAHPVARVQLRKVTKRVGGRPPRPGPRRAALRSPATSRHPAHSRR